MSGNLFVHSFADGCQDLLDWPKLGKFEVKSATHLLVDLKKSYFVEKSYWRKWFLYFLLIKIQIESFSEAKTVFASFFKPIRS